MSPDIHGVLEGESVVEQRIRGMPVLWDCEGPIVFPDTSTQAHYTHLPSITTTIDQKCEDWRDFIRGRLSARDYNFRIVSEQSPLLSTRESVRCNEACLRVSDYGADARTDSASHFLATRVQRAIYECQYAQP